MKIEEEIPTPPPIEYVKFVMDQMGWKQADLTKFGCGESSHISEYLNKRRRMGFTFIRNFLKAAHRKNMAYILIQDYKLKK